MVKIKYIEDTEGNKIFPVTHERSVRDDSGVTLESKLQMQTELINQSQMEIGAVESDNEPTILSTHWVTSGGIYNAFDKYVGILEDLSQYTVQKCSLGGSAKWYYSSTEPTPKHIAVPVSAGETIKFIGSGTSSVFYAFVTSSYAPPYNINSAIPLVSSESERVQIQQNSLQTVVVPEDAAYLILNIVDGGGISITWSLERVNGRLELSSRVKTLEGLFTNFEYGFYSPVPSDLNNVSSCGGYIEVDTGEWKSSTTYYGKIISFPINAIRRLRVTKNANGVCRIAFLTANTFTNNTQASFCTGTSQITILEEESPKEFEVPESCNYLYAYTYSRGTNVTPIIEFYTNKTDIVQKEIDDIQNVKLRIAHWNVGHFALGTSYDTLITHDQYDTMRAKWAEKVNSINADILMCCEYNVNFVNASGDDPAITARNAIFPACIYNNAYIGTKPGATSYMRTAIFSNVPISNVSQVVYPNTTQAGRYYQVGDLVIGNITIKVIETHLDFNQGSTGEANRASQIQKLINDFAAYDYVILAADFNVETSSEYDTFTNAGYRMANHGYLGDMLTYPAGDSLRKALDNILCKGFTINNINIVNDAELTDHCAVYADFTLIR